jgi:hypothetical protein
MARTKYHVTRVPGTQDWRVKREGAKRADSIHQDKFDAVARGREVARGTLPGQLIIHGRDGKIQTEQTYGSDPYPPRG